MSYTRSGMSPDNTPRLPRAAWALLAANLLLEVVRLVVH